MRNQYNRQLDRIQRREDRLFRAESAGPGADLLERVEEKIPEQLSETLDRAFLAAFQLLFRKGTGLFKRTMPTQRLETERRVREALMQERPDARNVRAFHKSGALGGAAATAAAAAEGCALGLLGLGLPDIPILLSILLRAVYQTAVRYGFAWDTPEERYYILLLLSAALAKGPARREYSVRADAYGRAVDHGERPPFDLEGQMRETAKALSGAMLTAKFIQGAPVVGVVGGASNFSATRRVTQTANLKYQKRFLEKKRRGA